MYDHCKYPAEIRLKYGVKRDGTIVAGELKTLVDIGAHNIQAYPLLGCMSGWFVSLYRMPHMNFEGTAVYTNKTPACAMQGYGNPDVSFAVESHMDIIAEKLGDGPHRAAAEELRRSGRGVLGPGPDGALDHQELRRRGDARQGRRDDRLEPAAAGPKTRPAAIAAASAWGARSIPRAPARPCRER